MRTTLPLFTLLAPLTAGCVEPEPPALATSAAEAGGSGGGGSDKDQSRFLLGAHLDAQPGFDASHKYAVVGADARDATNKPATVTFVAPGTLRAVDSTGGVHVGVDPWWNGVRLKGPGTSELKLAAVATSAGVTTYTVSHRTSPTAPWIDACDGDTAVPIVGSYTTTWAHEATSGKITLACGTGVVDKCLDWGYPSGTTAGSAAWNLNQACTRMASSDVCGNGQPQTRTGTYIRVFDQAGINLPAPTNFPTLSSWPPSHNDYWLEGGWGPNGAVCQSRPRWQSLTVGAMCGGALPDPREDAGAHFCDTQSTAQMASLGALLFDTTRFNDLPLATWTSGTNRILSARGYHKGLNAAEFPETPPFAGYTYESRPDVAFIIRSLPEGYDPSAAIAVSLMQNSTGDVVLAATDAPPAGYAPLAENANEGWIWASPGGGRVELHTYQHPFTRDLTTGTSAPAGYTDLGLLGYVLTER